MPIVNPFNARVYWPFQGSASFVDPFRFLCFMLVFVIPYFLYPVALCRLLGGAGILAFLCVVFSCVLVAFPCGVPGRVWCLVVSVPDFCLHFNLAN